MPGEYIGDTCAFQYEALSPCVRGGILLERWIGSGKSYAKTREGQSQNRVVALSRSILLM